MNAQPRNNEGRFVVDLEHTSYLVAFFLVVGLINAESVTPDVLPFSVASLIFGGDVEQSLPQVGSDIGGFYHPRSAHARRAHCPNDRRAQRRVALHCAGDASAKISDRHLKQHPECPEVGYAQVLRACR